MASQNSINNRIPDANFAVVLGKVTVGSESPGNPYDISIERSTAGVLGINVENTSVNAAASTMVQLTGQPGTGDVQSAYTVEGVVDYSVGVDNSDSDAFKITTGASPSLGSEAFSVQSNGDIGLGNDILFGRSIDIGTGFAPQAITIGNGSGPSGPIPATSVIVDIGIGGFGGFGTNNTIHTTSVGSSFSTSSTNIRSGGGTLDISTQHGLLNINSRSGAMSIATDADSQFVNIATGAGGKFLTIGSVTGTASTAIRSGTGGLSLASTGTGDITIDSDDTLLLDADGVLELNSSGGAISIGNDADSGAINIGTSTTARQIDIGFSAANHGIRIGAATGSLGVSIESGTSGATVNSVGGSVSLTGSTGAVIDSAAGAIDIGVQANAQPINIGTGASARAIAVGNSTTTTSVAITSGTGSISLTSTGTGDITINSDDTLLLDADGVLELNSSAGAISIGNDADAQAINIGTGAAARTITIGNTTSTTDLDLRCGTGDFTLASATGTIMSALDTGEITYPLQPAFSAYVSSTLSNVTGNGTLYGPIVFDTEIFDRNGDYNNATGLFTAPVTGVYLLQATVTLADVGAAHTTGNLRFVISSGSSRISNFVSPASCRDASSQYTMEVNAIAVLAAAETVGVSVFVDGSTLTVDILSLGGTAIISYFSGYLLA